MNNEHRKPLPGTNLDYFDTRAAVEALQPGAYDKLPYTSRVLAENLVRRCDPETLEASLRQLIERKSDLDFPWFPARVVCHDILGQTALVDLAGLRDAIAEQGGDPAQVNPVVPVQLIVDHSLAVECGGYDPRGVHQEPRHRGPSQRGPLPLHRLDEAGIQEHGSDPAWQRNHAPDQSGENVAGGAGARWRGLPGYLRRHRQPHAARRCVGRDRHWCRRAGSGERDAGARLVDAPARYRRRAADRQAAARHHRHRYRAGADRVPAQVQGRRRVAGILRRRRDRADPGRSRDHFQHGAGIRRHRRDVLHRPADARLLAADRARGGASAPGGNLCQAHWPVGGQPDGRRIRARAAVRPVQRGAQHGGPVESARARRDQRPGGQGHRGRMGRCARIDAGWRGDHRRDHQLYQHQQSTQRCRRRACWRAMPTGWASSESRG